MSKKVAFTIHILSLNNLFPYEGKQVYLIWKRGKKKENSGKTPSYTVNKNSCSWKCTVNINATLYPGKGPAGFKEKLLKFHLKVIDGVKTRDVAKCYVDLGKPMDDEFIKLEWIEKPSRTFDSLLKSNPAQLHVK